MIITRKTKIPLHWAFYAQLPLLMSIYGEFVINAPFLLLIKRFIDNPAAIMGLISLEIYISILGSPFISWLSDRVWTKWGRRKIFITFADIGKGVCVLLMPFAPNLILLISLRWLFDAFSNFGSMTQALVYEVVPTPQRGRLAGFFHSSIQFGNLVFYFLLLGRFDDMYFMGPLDFSTSISGGAVMFWIAAIVLFCIAAYESLGFKEIKPPTSKTLQDGRKPGQSVFTYFGKSFFKDIFARDLMPLYLLAFVDVMFRIDLGLFQPLQFTEQWGYSLQQMGNTIAIGVLFSVTFALFSGWFADRYGKMKTFVIASVGSLLVNLAFVAYLGLKPGHRPNLTEIVVFSNLQQPFSMVKAVITFPLIMEYISRNRMGAANAGLQVMRTFSRSVMSVFVGLWILWWSLAFMPQAGYRVLTSYPEAQTKTELQAILDESGETIEQIEVLPAEPGHRDGSASKLWYLHKADEQVQELIEERKDLNNRIAQLNTKLNSPFASEEEKSAWQSEVDEARTRLAETENALDAGQNLLNEQVATATAQSRSKPGEQFQSAQFLDNQVQLTLATIGTANPELAEQLPQDLESPAIALKRDPASLRLVPQIEAQFEDGRIQLKARFRPSFVFLFQKIQPLTTDADLAYELATVLQSVHDAELGRDDDLYRFEPTANASDALSYSLSFAESVESSSIEQLVAALRSERLIGEASFSVLSDSHFELRLTLSHAAKNRKASKQTARIDEAKERLQSLIPSATPTASSLVSAFYLRVSDTLAAIPYNLTVPENATHATHKERVYEYFFSSRSLMIVTDILGFVIIALLVRLERKGVIHKYGVEEDQNR